MSDPGPTPGMHARSHKPRRWRRWLGLAAVLGLALCFGHFAYLRITRRPTPRPEYWQARLAELDPPPPGAISPAEVADLLTNRPWESHPALAGALDNRPIVAAVLNGPWDETRADIAFTSEVFQTEVFKTVRVRMQRAVKAGWCDIADPDRPFDRPSVTDYEVWTSWLLAHSRWAREHRDDPAAAAEDWLTALRLNWLLPNLLRVRTWHASTWIAREIILAASEATGPIDVTSLAAGIDEITGPTRTPAAIVEPDRLRVHGLLESWYVREGGDWLDVTEEARAWSSRYSPPGPTRTPPRIWNLASPLFYDLPTARKIVDDHYALAASCTDLVACAKLRDEQGRPSLHALCGYAFGMRPRPILILTVHYRTRTTLEAAVATVAVHEYRRRSGYYPPTLDELVPTLLGRLPIDYADRHTLRYHRTDDGYVLYSIGLDGKDDGGVGHPPVGIRTAWEEGDVVFSAIRRRELEP